MKCDHRYTPCSLIVTSHGGKRLAASPSSPWWNIFVELTEELAAFPYVNGDLFAERLRFAAFNREMRRRLLEATDFQWAKVSPAVFGSLFQGISGDAERRQQGAHYTSERDILKLIRSLFLDELTAELEGIRRDRSNRRRANLLAFHDRLRAMRFLDPACGCGNFLVLAYRELRTLELELLRELHAAQQLLDVHGAIRVDVDQFYGIELAEWPCRIAEVALWLMDHQMNLRVSEAFGERFERLPLRATPRITTGNALRLDWHAVLPPNAGSWVLGNPPFVGKKEQNADQKADMKLIWGDARGAGILDYVTCWYRKAADYIASESRTRCAFVSTNSISQGEQVGVLWDELFRVGIKIQFAHRTFSWTSEARGRAHVHVVIIGFGRGDVPEKCIYEYAHHDDAESIRSVVTNINPYLVEGGDTTLRTRTQPINGGPTMNYGSMMIDKDRRAGGESGLILTPEHRAALLEECPALAPYIRRLYGGDEFLNGVERWCLWLVDAPPDLLRRSSMLRARIQTVREFRLNSARPQTQALAATPTLFGEIRQPTTNYLLIPKVSSENRTYIPIGFMTPNEIASGSALIVPGATNYHFGVLSSAMHNAWMRAVAGRLESRFQYSSNIVYNNFPWPSDVVDRQRAMVSAAADAVIEARQQFPDATLSDLYDPLAMPARLAGAHGELDRAVDRCYRTQPFRTDRERVEHLFAIYERLTAPLIPAPLRRRRGRSAGP